MLIHAEPELIVLHLRSDTSHLLLLFDTEIGFHDLNAALIDLSV